jgi:uncharacterized hydrophobic protein (TIGR00271 family)
MLHVRVVSPYDLTRRLVEALAAAPGVRNLVVLPGAARRPDGDAVQFDVHNRSANPVFRQLRGLHLDHRGSVTVENVTVTLVDSGGRAEVAGASHRERAPVWEVVEATVRAGAAYPPGFFILLAIAGLIGAVGILVNSQILVVGAMVVGPEYNAIIATALGISQRDWAPVRAGMSALFWGFLLAIAVTYCFALVIRVSGQAPAAFRVGIRPVADLINSPNLFSVVVAVLAGVVGVVSLTEARANALIGVFISITTIPAASAVGVSAAFGSWHEARGSLLQLLLNVILLVAVGAAGLVAQRAIWQGRAADVTRSRSG